MQAPLVPGTRLVLNLNKLNSSKFDLYCNVLLHGYSKELMFGGGDDNISLVEDVPVFAPGNVTLMEHPCSQ